MIFRFIFLSTSQATAQNKVVVIPLLDEKVIEKENYAPVEKTGQTVSHNVWCLDDGCIKKGVAWPNPRFTDNGDGTVTDNLTELIWLKNADCFGQVSWSIEDDPLHVKGALGLCFWLEAGNCGLTDGSAVGKCVFPM